MEWDIDGVLIGYFPLGVDLLASVVLYFTSTNRILKGWALIFFVTSVLFHLFCLYLYYRVPEADHGNLDPLILLILPDFLIFLPLFFIQVFLMACENYKNRKQRKAAKIMEYPAKTGVSSSSATPPTSS